MCSHALAVLRIPAVVDDTVIALISPNSFTVGVLNATLDLAALVLVGVAAFLGSEAVLAPLRSLHVGCLNCLGSTLVFFLLYIITVE